MRVNVNVLIGFLLCVLILCVVGVMRRVDENQDAWHPNEMYTHLGGSSYTSSSVSSHSSDGVVVAMRGVSRPSRRYAAAPAFSYAPTQYLSIASTQNPIGGTLSNSSTGGLYTTSSATMKSFGAGMAAGGGMSMSGGSVRNSQSPLVSNQSPIAYSQLPVDMYASAYTPLASPIATVGANSVAALPARSGMMSGPRRVAPVGGGWDRWLSGLGADGGFLYGDENNRYYDMEKLYRAFQEAQKNGNFPGWTWEEFLEKYFNAEGQNKHHVPLGEPWVLLILALAYVGYVFIRRTRARGI